MTSPIPARTMHRDRVRWKRVPDQALQFVAQQAALAGAEQHGVLFGTVAGLGEVHRIFARRQRADHALAVGPGENHPPAAGVLDPDLDGVEVSSSVVRATGRSVRGKQCGRGRLLLQRAPGCGSCACFLRQSSIAFRSAELHGVPAAVVLRGQLRRCTAIGAWPDPDFLLMSNSVVL